MNWIPFLGSILLGIITYKTRILDISGSVGAALISMIIWGLRGLGWIIPFILFTTIGYSATRWNYKIKRKEGIAEGRSGKRGIENVFGNGLAPLLFAFIGNPLPFLGSIATALADSMASEIGVLSPKARSIITFKEEVPGTDGAVSLLGTLAAAAGSLAIASLGVLLLQLNLNNFFLVFIAGFLGCQIDSILGATLERRGYLSKSHVNLLATFSGGLITLL